MTLRQAFLDAGFDDLAQKIVEGEYEDYEFYKPPENPVPKVNKIATVRMCTSCGKMDTGLQLCGRCKIVYYCNENCQRKAWDTHKLTCKAPVKK